MVFPHVQEQIISQSPRFFKRGPWTVHLRSTEVALIVLLLGHGAYWFHGDFPMENPKLKRMMTWENPP
jgi:hypothetical protein